MSTTLECCAPRRLTTAEREHYDTHGYVVVSGLFTPEEVKAYDDELSRLMREDGVNKQRGERFIHRMELHSKLMDDFMKDPRVLMLLEDIIYPGLSIHSTKVLEKKPHDTVVCHWHQDEYYYRDAAKGQESTCSMSVWMPTIDTGPHNGGMRVIPGSHKPGVLDHQRFEYDTCRFAIRDGHESMPGEIDCPVKAGELLLFSAKLLHSSRGNASDKPRRAIIISYQEATRADGRPILRSA